MWIVMSRQSNATVTCYGPFVSSVEANAWRNSVADPQTDKTTVNTVHCVHSSARIVSK